MATTKTVTIWFYFVWSSTSVPLAQSKRKVTYKTPCFWSFQLVATTCTVHMSIFAAGRVILRHSTTKASIAVAVVVKACPTITTLAAAMGNCTPSRKTSATRRSTATVVWARNSTIWRMTSAAARSRAWSHGTGRERRHLRAVSTWNQYGVFRRYKCSFRYASFHYPLYEKWSYKSVTNWTKNPGCRKIWTRTFRLLQTGVKHQ